MPAIPNLLERLLLITTNKGPGPILDLLGAGGLQALSAAIEVGLLDHLASHGPASGEEVAGALDLDVATTEALLSFLAPLGYVKAKRGSYEVTGMTERWILDSSPGSLGRWLRFWQELVLPYVDEHLPKALRGEPPDGSFYDWLGQAPGRWALAQATFEDLAEVVADEIVDKVPVPEDAARLLDIGGGHGRYAMALCQAHPGLEATVLDLEAPLASARANLDGDPLADRISLQAGDYLVDDLGHGFDVVLVFNVLHGHRAPEAQQVVSRAAEALAPGGLLVVADQFPGLTIGPATRGMTGLLGLMYLVALQGGTHEADDVETWMSHAGLTDPQVRKLRDAPGAALILARRPPHEG